MDGTIIPHFFGVVSRGAVSVADSLSNISLYVGEVKAIYYPEDKLSQSKKYVEYTVEAVISGGGSTTSSTPLTGCIVSQLFGGFADQVSYTVRPNKQQSGQDSKGGVGVGSKVLVMCINGTRSNPVIIGGIPDNNYAEKDKHTKEDGHNLFFEFNGTQFTINKDGELKLTFRGATQVDGTLMDSAVADAEGSYIEINKEGNIKIATPKDDQFIHINHKDKKVEMQAQKEWDVTIKGTVNITADQNVNIKSSGVLVGDATDSWMLGTTYRNGETQANTQISAAHATLTSLMATAGASILAAAALNAIPVVGGGLASPGFVAAGTALTSAGPIFAQIQAALTTFEGQAATYLSKKNKND